MLLPGHRQPLQRECTDFLNIIKVCFEQAGHYSQKLDLISNNVCANPMALPQASWPVATKLHAFPGTCHGGLPSRAARNCTARTRRTERKFQKKASALCLYKQLLPVGARSRRIRGLRQRHGRGIRRA